MGFQLATNKGMHYQTMEDLLGATQFTNLNTYTELARSPKRSGMKPVFISKTPKTSTKTSSETVVMIGFGSFILKSLTDCLSAKYEAGNNSKTEKAGADQWGRIGRVSEKNQNKPMNGKAKHNNRRPLFFLRYLFPLKNTTNAMIINI